MICVLQLTEEERQEIVRWGQSARTTVAGDSDDKAQSSRLASKRVLIDGILQKLGVEYDQEARDKLTGGHHDAGSAAGSAAEA